jgi:hypothetical protein
VPSAKSATEQLRIVVAAPHHCERTGDGDVAPSIAVAPNSYQIFANVFDGGPKTRVAYQLSGHTPGWTSMERASVEDPFIVDAFVRYRKALKSWVQPVASSHVWRAELPFGLRPGARKIVARASDEYGRLHTAHTIIEISDEQNRSARL